MYRVGLALISNLMASGRKPPRQSTLDTFVRKGDGSPRDQSQKILGGPIRRAGGHVRHSPINSRPEGRQHKTDEGRTHKTDEGACGGPTRIPGEQSSPTVETKPSLKPCATKAGGLRFSEVKGDLFSCPDSASLAHCVSEDMAMGKGIAVLFKKKFGGVAELKSQGIKTGGLAVLQRQDRYIYYMVTKPRYFHKPTYDTLHSSLQALYSHCISNGVKELCMPRIGCGLDQLKWESVSAMIQETFASSDISITVYFL